MGCEEHSDEETPRPPRFWTIMSTKTMDRLEHLDDGPPGAWCRGAARST